MAGLALLSPALAQTAPDAGALQQQVERERRATPVPRDAPPTPMVANPRVALPAGTTVLVKAFRFSGNRLLSDARLQSVLDAYLGRQLGLAELQQATDEVARTYRSAGRVAFASLPRQDVTEGTVTIQVTEAVMGQVRTTAPTSALVQPERVAAAVAALNPPGSAIDARTLDRALLLADDLPGVSVAGSLRAGEQAGQTDLLLSLSNKARLAGEISADNAGARSTGSARLSANLALASPTGRGDLAQLGLLHSAGNDYGRLAYSLPLGDVGWRVGASASTLRYHLTSADFAGLDARGSSQTLGLDASYPLLRATDRNLSLSLNADRKRYDNQAAGATQSNYRVDSLSLGLSGNLNDALGGGGSTVASLALVQGRLDLGALDGGENSALAGRSTKWRYALARNQALGGAWSLYAAISGQQGPTRLDSSERFTLGGASGVRAYPTSEASGSSGTLATLELRWRASGAMLITAFADHGRVRSGDGGGAYTLKGRGLAAAWYGAKGLSVKAAWAQRAGDNPNPTATGRDQDGSAPRARLWLSLGLAF